MKLKNKIILITGAHGFIGRHLALFLSNQGARVYGVGHGSWDKTEWKSWGLLEWHTCNITLDNLILHGSIPDIIFHCGSGSSVPFSISNPMQDFEKSLNSTVAVLNFMRLKCSSSRLVLLSSAAVYGDTKNGPISENEPLNPLSPYGLHKKIKEELCVFYSKLYKLNIAIVRFFSVYGPGMRKQLLWETCNSLLKEQKIFSGTGLETRDWIHIHDVVSLLILASNYSNTKVPIINGGTGKATAVKDIVNLLAKIFKFPQPKFSGIERKGDPLHMQADIANVKSWAWIPKYSWDNGVKEYAEWFRQINEEN